MTARPLHLVATAQAVAEPTLTCQARLSGHLDTAVRVLTPVGCHGTPQVAIRIGPLLLLIGDQIALTDAADAIDRGRHLARTAFGSFTPAR